ncbi:FHA domain-containing protein [Oscillatoria sp. FACHB-1407]|uniref:FHA domain-containing protein n=1 Tax=Oscillatoria sp. FACHB-1407 TaxID=2692847 RepID=UPI001685A518|nr:FHA domain-containing protein [Oscillatoria sp. FACHB-1407]MBD2460361.1 FHA domain-containing protein [Oscillatoria sp. FACHB-1407]
MSNEHLLILEDDQGQREIFLTASIYSIGRSSKCNIQIFSQFASRCHASLILIPANRHRSFYRIVDGDIEGNVRSQNGLFVNGNKVAVHNLRDRDRIVFGSQAHAIYYCLRKNHNINSQIAKALEEFPTATVEEYKMAIASPEESVTEKAPASD